MDPFLGSMCHPVTFPFHLLPKFKLTKIKSLKLRRQGKVPCSSETTVKMKSLLVFMPKFVALLLKLVLAPQCVFHSGILSQGRTQMFMDAIHAQTPKQCSALGHVPGTQHRRPHSFHGGGNRSPKRVKVPSSTAGE